MDIQKKEVSVNIPVASLNASAIIDSDAIVNDSKPDLLKILQIDASVKVSKAEVMNVKMMIGGHVAYKVLYQPENASGVFSIHTGADFSHMEENSDFADGMHSCVTAEVEHLESELINSRKIKIKSVVTLGITVELLTPVMLPLEVIGDNIQTKLGTFGGQSKLLQKRDIITVSDSLSLPAGKPNIGSLLKSDVSLCNKDVKVIAGKVIIKGELAVCNLYVPEAGGLVDYCSHTLPFTEILDAEGLNEDHMCHVRTDVEECDFSLATDSDGDIRVINANIRVGVKISADATVSENVVTDVYSLTDNLDIGYNTINLQNPVVTSDFDYTIKNSVRPGRGSSSILSVYNMTATPSITATTSYDDKLSVEGYVDLASLCITSDENCPIMNHTEEIPFKIDVDAQGCRSGMEMSAEVEVNNISYNLNVSGEIDVRIVLSCHTQVLEKGKIAIVNRVESTGCADNATPSIVLYFVQKGDTLWDIAKRYHTKTEYIEELNGENCNPLKCGSQLLIPRG